ncbi:TetR family transcriptional regulator [Microbacterium sp. RURRCA19A]|uniref:TetR family transcriptional regulator n=1 Tax=Microbacterium sp. RURRCA19A TaxID=1907391 RepID=UPI000955E7C8|nr:TetR family transcriptional regulator [Microbacterium sp. RURRCA19A]SIS09134.1 transcriptional regulator, TetR family [Microbacterium sp. RURRCA19A]
MSSPAESGGRGLREIARDAVRSRITEVALELFAEHGFDNVTVEQIAAEVGISARSFNRYFPTKEDAALGDAFRWGHVVRDNLATRPADESVWTSLQASYEALLAIAPRHVEQDKRSMQVLMSTSSLRAKNIEKHLSWANLLTPVVADRLRGDDREYRAATIVQASLVCFDIAMQAWAKPGEQTPPTEFLRTAFDQLRDLG